jgi:hypothetical protein
MSLTLALAIVGVLVLAALIAHSVWTARKLGVKRAEVQPSSPIERREPDRVEPAFELPATLGDPSSVAEPRALRRRANARLDALIDAIAPLTLEAPVSAELALSHLPPTRRAGSKPFMIEGLNAENGEWEPITLGQRYGEFQAGVQLANRAGAINEIEYSEFVQKVEAFAEPVGAMADFPDMLDVVARARELDNFASAHDAQLAVHLKARGAAWSVGYIQQQASRHGFVPGVVPGRLILPSTTDGAPAVLTLSFDSQAALADDLNLTAVRDLTLAFDVPQTEQSSAPFAAWRASALALSRDMDAVVADDNGQALDESAFTQIDAELARLYEAMQGRDLAAGSPAARRLFS